MPHLITLTVYRDNVTFDITNVTDKLFRSRELEGDISVKAQSRNEESDQNDALISRYLNKYNNKVKSRMQAYLIRDDSNMTTTEETETIDGVEYVTTTTEESVDNDLIPLMSGDFVYNLTFPIRWQHESVDELTENVHDYLVNGCIFEMLRISNPKEAAIYKQTMDQAWTDMKYAITTREDMPRYGRQFDERMR